MFEQEYAPRWRKAKKIIAILQDYFGERLRDARALDLGCGNGIITDVIGKAVGEIVGIDIDEAALQEAQASGRLNSFLLGDGAKLPFPDDSYDLVICAQVYEHAYDQPGLIAEIKRILRPDGVCFFSGPNRLALMEEHYWLPFLSWLPKSGADLYLKLTGRGHEYDVKPLTYWQLRRLWHGFAIVDYTPQLFCHPARYSVEDELGRFQWLSSLPCQIWKAAAPFLPNYNWVLVNNPPMKETPT